MTRIASFLLLSPLFLSLSAARPTLDQEKSDLAPRDLESRSIQPITSCTKSGDFALTFDDGPYLYGGSIAELLESQSQRSRGTFFVNGYNYDCIYDYSDELIRRYKAGHMIASHTWNHRDITTLSEADLRQQITLVEKALGKILGVKPKYFRPPYGSYNDKSMKIIQSMGYKIVTWDFDSGDSTGSTYQQSISAYTKLYRKYPKSYLALNHETYKSTASKVIPTVIPRLLQVGYKLVTVAECLGDSSPYQSVFAAGKRDSSWTCDGTPAPGPD